MDAYPLGQTVRLEAVITDNATGELRDPATLTCTVNPPKGPNVLAEVFRDSEGKWHAEITPQASGVWSYRFEGDVTSHDTVGENSFFVNPSSVI